MAVSPSDLRVVYPSTDMSDNDLQVFIDTASLVVSETLVGASLSEDRKDLITVYLAAHFLVLTNENGGLRRSRLGDGDESYAIPDTKMFGYATTRFGQAALTLDVSGKLAASQAGKNLKAQLRVV